MPEDPRTHGPRPPFLGRGRDLDPKPDYGETRYIGAGRMRDLVAIVAGADAGIGRAVAIAFAREGADVVIGYETQSAEAEETARWVREAGRRAVLLAGDLNTVACHQALVERATAQLGRLDVLVNDMPFSLGHGASDDQAGGNAVSPIDIEAALRSSSEAVLSLAEAAAEHMKPGAAIVTTAPARAPHSVAHQRAYAAYRNGAASQTVQLATKLASRGIRVNAVEPGPVWAPRLLLTLTGEQRRRFGGDTLLGRPAQPAEFAPLYVFLASDEASFITGAVLAVNGGWFDRQAAL